MTLNLNDLLISGPLSTPHLPHNHLQLWRVLQPEAPLNDQRQPILITVDSEKTLTTYILTAKLEE